MAENYYCFNRHLFAPCGHQQNTTDAGCVGCQCALNTEQARTAIPPGETAQQRTQRTWAERWRRT